MESFDLQHAKRLVSKAKLKEAIEYLIEFTKALRKKDTDKIYLTSSRLKKVENDFLSGLRSVNDRDIELNKIGKSLLSLINQIQVEGKSEQRKVPINNYYSLNVGFENLYEHLQKRWKTIENQYIH